MYALTQVEKVQLQHASFEERQTALFLVAFRLVVRCPWGQELYQPCKGQQEHSVHVKYSQSGDISVLNYGETPYETEYVEEIRRRIL